MINEANLKEMSREDALKLYIPKWPQCIINGNKITPEQADEIIRRTDCYFEYPHCNDRAFDNKFKEISKGILDPDYLRSIDDSTDWLKEYKKYQELSDKFYNDWGYIKLNYLSNDFIASNFIFGASGWCHPDGTIAFIYNIGKWPSIEEVELDLQKITKEFPFLKLECTLCMYEHGEWYNESIITMIAEKGNVKFYEPVPYNELEKVEKRYTSHCFSIDHIKEWIDKIDLDKNKGEINYE